MSTPLETTNYMIAGFVFVFVVMGLYIASFFIRIKNLERDLELMEELENKD